MIKKYKTIGERPRTLRELQLINENNIELGWMIEKDVRQSHIYFHPIRISIIQMLC